MILVVLIMDIRFWKFIGLVNDTTKICKYILVDQWIDMNWGSKKYNGKRIVFIIAMDYQERSLLENPLLRMLFVVTFV